jgi:hypothetical protein
VELMNRTVEQITGEIRAKTEAIATAHATGKNVGRELADLHDLVAALDDVAIDWRAAAAQLGDECAFGALPVGAEFEFPGHNRRLHKVMTDGYRDLADPELVYTTRPSRKVRPCTA